VKTGKIMRMRVGRDDSERIHRIPSTHANAL
jgi:hypothetical protein